MPQKRHIGVGPQNIESGTGSFTGSSATAKLKSNFKVITGVTVKAVKPANADEATISIETDVGAHGRIMRSAAGDIDIKRWATDTAGLKFTYIITGY